MNDNEILALAFSAHNQHGAGAKIRVLVSRFPKSRSVQQLRIKPQQGPWGRIIALTPAGTELEFEAIKLISFYKGETASRAAKRGPARAAMTEDRVQIKPVVKRANLDRIKEIAAASNISLSAIMDVALGEYIERYA